MESPSANEDARAAVSNNDEEKLRNALGRGADANFTWTQGRHSPQYSLLTSAARNGFDGCCRLLLARGADPNLSTGHLVRLPMHEACVGAVRRGKVAERCACVRHLLDAGADPNLRDWYGDVVLHIACEGEEEMETVKLLIQRGANLEAKNEAGRTPLGVAVAGGTRNTALFLLRAGAKMQILKHRWLSPRNRDLNDYMVDIVNEGGWAARARKHEDACLRVVSRCVRLPRDVMLSIASYWSLPH